MIEIGEEFEYKVGTAIKKLRLQYYISLLSCQIPDGRVLFLHRDIFADQKRNKEAEKHLKKNGW